MLERQILTILVLVGIPSVIHAEKVLAGGPNVHTGIIWQSESMNLAKVRNQMSAVQMIISEGIDTCFSRRVNSNPYVISKICNHDGTDAYGGTNVTAYVHLCVPDTLVAFASFNSYLLEQIRWLDSIEAIHLSVLQFADIEAESKLPINLYGSYYLVDSSEFHSYILSSCNYNPGDLPLPIMKRSATNNTVEQIASNNRLVWRGFSNSANYNVLLQNISGRQLASQGIRAHGGQLEWEGNIPSKPFLATIQSEDGAVVWSALVP